MKENHHYIKIFIKKISPLLLFFCIAIPAFPQKKIADSLQNLLAKETVDTNRVILLWKIADAARRYDPDTALYFSQKALFLARRKNYVEGESRSLGILANTFMSIGNYPRALELNLEKLKLEEKRDRHRNLASVLMNIGIVYVLQDEYRTALQYYAKADSVITKFNVEDFKYNIAENTGDAYNRLNISDSAYIYFDRSLQVAQKLTDTQLQISGNTREGLIGGSLTGLGHAFTKLGNYTEALLNYQNAIKYLQDASDDETLCEAALGIANLYQKINKPDSSRHFAGLSFEIAKRDGFLSKEFDAANFLMEFFKKTKDIDNAFAYSDLVHQLNDSLNSKAKIREAQILSSNEQFRQRALEEERVLAAKKRYQQLQLLLIGIFIPGLFLITLLLSVSKIHINVIRGLGVLSLLFFFEYLTLLLHPKVSELTNHTPVFEILIFVGLAAILIPLHHRAEHWLIHRLIHHRIQHEDHNVKKEMVSIEK